MPERYYCPEMSGEGLAVLQGDQAHHLSRVRRVEPGETVFLFDGRGAGWKAKVSKLRKDRVELILREPIADRRPRMELTLATTVPKGDRFDWLVEKATELGVARLVPIRAERSSVEPRLTKLDRLRRVVIEASKQCGRNRLMELGDPTDWPTYLQAEGAALRVLADPLGATDWSDDTVKQSRHAALAIGPEGGFTGAEIALAEAAGWQRKCFSTLILRIETAALAGCALMLAGNHEGNDR